MFHEDTCGLGPVELNEALRSLPAELAIEMASQWHPSVRSLIELQDPSFTIGMRIYSADPNIEAWTPSGRVTVMGDAVHLMSVCGGVGAVAALNDAHTLVKVISEEGVSISSIGKYEEKMRDFAKVCIQRSYEVGRELLAVPDFQKCRKVDL
jgi:2-polyprenyl-6-methoxyphenol hydroxylase-like FAD-dependent oxidoreductase